MSGLIKAGFMKKTIIHFILGDFQDLFTFHIYSTAVLQIYDEFDNCGNKGRGGIMTFI